MLLVAGAAGAAVVLAGTAALLLSGDDAPAPSSAAADASPQPELGLSPAVLGAIAADRTPADARAALEEQLAARADANLALLRSTWQGDESAAARAARAVAASSRGTSSVVSAWHDTGVATDLRKGLDAQTAASRAYAAAVAADDVDAADKARAAMGQISRDVGALLDGITDGRIAAYVPPQDAAQYRAFVDALEAEDAETAREAADWLRARLAREGTALALGLSGGGPT